MLISNANSGDGIITRIHVQLATMEVTIDFGKIVAYKNTIHYVIVCLKMEKIFPIQQSEVLQNRFD